MQEFDFTLTLEDVKTINDALVQMPWFRANDLLGKLQKQINDQTKETPPKSRTR